MRPQSKKPTTFYCFSPPVMLATIVIEISLLVYTLVRFKMTPIVRMAATLLVLLTTFQVAEYNVCGSQIGAADMWSRFGYVAITMLPALGIHFVLMIAQKTMRWLLWIVYGLSVAFAATFAISSTAFNNHICTGNYVIFQLAHPVGGMYFTYYFTLLFIGIGMCLYFSRQVSQKRHNALIFQIVGYLSFMLPTAIVNDANPQTIDALPSVMCGFAILYALIIVLGILPLTSEPKEVKSTHQLT